MLCLHSLTGFDPVAVVDAKLMERCYLGPDATVRRLLTFAMCQHMGTSGCRIDYVTRNISQDSIVPIAYIFCPDCGHNFTRSWDPSIGNSRELVTWLVSMIRLGSSQCCDNGD